MAIAEQEFKEITRNIWATTLGLDLRSQPESVHEHAGSQAFVASVQISGAWQGGVSLHCPSAHGRRIAELMLGTEPSDGDVRDALGELANMIGGNLKACLPSPSQLSLPSVSEGSTMQFSILGARPLREIRMFCEESAIRVVLWERVGTNDPGGR